MAENTVVKEYLSDAMIEAGARLTAKLDEANVPITAAFWFYDSEVNEWRLFFASPEVSTKGNTEVYKRIQPALKALATEGFSISSLLIRLLDANDRLVRLLSSAVVTGPGVSRIRFSKNAVNGHFIDDALIYRLTRAAA